MKAIYKHIAFAALALSAVACSQDDDFAPSYLSDPDAVRITAQVGTADVTGGFTRSNPLGTAEEQAQFNTGDQISVTAGTQAPVTYQLGTDGWKPVGEAYLKWQTNEMNVTAYYPVGKNNASATTFTVPTEYTDEKPIAEADYMTYSGTQTKGDDKSINLEMQRKMVRLVITPEFNDQFPEEDYSVTMIKVHANTTGYANGTPVTGDVTVTAYKHTDNAFYALLAPTTADADATFLTVTVSDGTTSQELTVKGIPATAAGNSYSFALTVGKDKVAMGTVSVKDWTEATIDGGEATEVKVETIIEGSTATITVPELATDAMVQNAVTEALADNATLLMINDQLTDAQQTAIATALTGKSDIALVMGGVPAPTTTITELADIDLAYKNGTGENGHVVVADGYIVTSKAGLDAWRTAATSDVSTNLTLACDIEYNANWSRLEVNYNGTINGNGYAIIGLNCSASNSAGFIYNLDGEGVIKYLGIVGGSFSNSESIIGCGSRAFVSDNYGVIMGCYNTSSCTSAGGREDYGNAAGFSTYNETTGKIIACYNTGTISAGGSYGSGISCYNKGVISGCYNTGAVSGKGESLGYYASAITSANRKTINDCYYTQPSRGYETDPSNPSYSNTATATNITKVAGSDWTDAKNKMNAAIEAYNADEANTVKCNYRYVLNTDAATKEAQPLVIVEASATE